MTGIGTSGIEIAGRIRGGWDEANHLFNTAVESMGNGEVGLADSGLPEGIDMMETQWAKMCALRAEALDRLEIERSGYTARTFKRTGLIRAADTALGAVTTFIFTRAVLSEEDESDAMKSSSVSAGAVFVGSIGSAVRYFAERKWLGLKRTVLLLIPIEHGKDKLLDMKAMVELVGSVNNLVSGDGNSAHLRRAMQVINDGVPMAYSDTGICRTIKDVQRSPVQESSGSTLRMRDVGQVILESIRNNTIKDREIQVDARPESCLEEEIKKASGGYMGMFEIKIEKLLADMHEVIKESSFRLRSVEHSLTAKTLGEINFEGTVRTLKENFHRLNVLFGVLNEVKGSLTGMSVRHVGFGVASGVQGIGELAALAASIAELFKDMSSGFSQAAVISLLVGKTASAISCAVTSEWMLKHEKIKEAVEKMLSSNPGPMILAFVDILEDCSKIQAGKCVGISADERQQLFYRLHVQKNLRKRSEASGLCSVDGSCFQRNVEELLFPQTAFPETGRTGRRSVRFAEKDTVVSAGPFTELEKMMDRVSSRITFVLEKCGDLRGSDLDDLTELGEQFDAIVAEIEAVKGKEDSEAVVHELMSRVDVISSRVDEKMQEIVSSEEDHVRSGGSEEWHGEVEFLRGQLRRYSEAAVKTSAGSGEQLASSGEQLSGSDEQHVVVKMDADGDIKESEASDTGGA